MTMEDEGNISLEERLRLNKAAAANVPDFNSMQTGLSMASSGIGSENPYLSSPALDAASTTTTTGPITSPVMPMFGDAAVEFAQNTPYNPVDPNSIPNTGTGAAMDTSGLLNNIDITTAMNQNMFKFDPENFYQAFIIANGYPDVGLEQFIANIESGAVTFGNEKQTIDEYSKITGLNTELLINSFAKGGTYSPENDVLEKYNANPQSLSGVEQEIFNELLTDVELGKFVPKNQAFRNINVTDSSGNNISTGLPGSEVAGFTPDQQLQASDYLREIQKYLTGLTDVVPTLPTNLSSSYVDASGNQQNSPEYQILIDAYQGALAEQSGRALGEEDFQRELTIQENQLNADSDALAQSIDAQNYSSYISAYNNDNNISLQKQLSYRNDALERYKISETEQLARITGQNQEDVQNIISAAQISVAERNGITAREVAEIQAGVSTAIANAEINTASIERQMQQEIARTTGLDQRYIAEQQAEAQKSVAAENRAAQERIALESRTSNIAIAQSANTTEAEIAKISADAQILIAEDNRISQEKVALANSLNVVAAAEATGLSQEKVASIQGEFNKLVAEATGLSAQEVATLQGSAQEQIAKIKAASEVQVAQQQAQAVTTQATTQAAEQRFATTTQAGTQQSIAQLQADTETGIARIQSDTSKDQFQKQLEIANLQQQTEEAVARIQQQGQLAVTQQQTNPFGLSTEEYIGLQSAAGTPSPADTLNTQQYIDLQNSLARGGLTPAQQIQLYEAQQQAQSQTQRAGLSAEDFIGLQESVARGGLTPEQRLAEQQQGQQVQALTSLLSLLSNPSALGSLSALSTGQTPFGSSIPSAAALQGRSDEFLNFLQGAFGALGVTPSALVNLVQGVTPGGISNPFGALTGQVA